MTKKGVRKKQRNFLTEKRFLVALLFVLVFVLLIFWHNNDQVAEKSKQHPSQNLTKASNDTEKYHLIPYINNDTGFSVLIPERIYFYGGGCQMEGESYRPKNQWAPTKVFQDGEKFFITSEYVYALLGVHYANGIAYFSDCKKQLNTIQSIEQGGTEGVVQEILPFFVGSVKDPSQITSFVQRNIWNNYKLGKLVSIPGRDYQRVELDLVNPNEFAGQGSVQIFYYPKQEKIVAWDLGYNHYIDPNGSNVDYTQQMIESFKFY